MNQVDLQNLVYLARVGIQAIAGKAKPEEIHAAAQAIQNAENIIKDFHNKAQETHVEVVEVNIDEIGGE